MPDIKNNMMKRLDHIQQLVKKKNYTEIEKLLEKRCLIAHEKANGKREH